jgi:hypothetical protein
MEKKQAQIVKGTQGFEIHNVGTTETITVDQNPVYAGGTLLLEPGMVILMGDIQMRFQTFS